MKLSEQNQSAITVSKNKHSYLSLDGNKRAKMFGLSEIPVVITRYKFKTIKASSGKTSKKRKLEKMFGLSKKRRIKNSWKNKS
tara:strand:+ start:69 stop:317 length:249 start_codon:yes stop_codon:yes gene_type:complete